MSKPKIYFHGSYIGTTGYNSHTRDFLRSLSKHSEIKVRNFTVGNSWDGYNSTPHDNEPYINEIDKSILYQQVLWNSDNTRSDYPIYPDESKNFKPDLNIVLCETNHHLFYDTYTGPKIAYNVWESTLQPKQYFDKLLEFDELWVPSKWQKECTIKQGYPKEKIKVVPEGVDVKTFYPEEIKYNLTSDGRFKFFLAGRWDYRKSIKEIIETFLKTFGPEEPVDLIISVDNPFSNDGLNSTEERLKHYGMEDDRIKVLHFPSREDYINLLKTSHCFVSCARSEGWNLPLIESMACGTPSIYSNCSGQLEFAQGKGIPVNIIGEKPVHLSTYNHFNESVGNYYEPDFDDLGVKMRSVVNNYTEYKKQSLEESKLIRENFSWERVAEIGVKTINEFLENRENIVDTNQIIVSYLNGPRVEVKGNHGKNYYVEFIDDDGVVRFSDTISNNMWTECSIKYYVGWTIKVDGIVVDKLDLTNKRVLISLESKSVGDTIAWVPYSIELMNKRKCKVVISTFHNEWFEGSEYYKDIEFIKPGQVTDCFAVYRIGWYRDHNGGWKNLNLQPNQPNLIPLQKTATDILGLEYNEINYGLSFKPKQKPYPSKYVVFGPQSTAGCKEWPINHWIELSNIFNEMGYKVVILSLNKYNIPNTISKTTKDWNEIFNCLYHADFFIGLSSGLSWVNWSLGKQTVMISGFSKKDHEFNHNTTRVSTDVCIKCWNDPVLTFDSGDWDWCPVYKNTERQHICQKSITPQMVFDQIKHWLK
jgi:autotransporter strand-loop-strand O-heptosyltransferase